MASPNIKNKVEQYEKYLEKEHTMDIIAKGFGKIYENKVYQQNPIKYFMENLQSEYNAGGSIGITMNDRLNAEQQVLMQQNEELKRQIEEVEREIENQNNN